MKKIIMFVLQLDEKVRKALSSYINNVNICLRGRESFTVFQARADECGGLSGVVATTNPVHLAYFSFILFMCESKQFF
jgi:hypothetical protein